MVVVVVVLFINDNIKAIKSECAMSVGVCCDLYVGRDRKLSISYKGSSQLPKEPELRELKLFVGMLCCLQFLRHPSFIK